MNLFLLKNSVCLKRNSRPNERAAISKLKHSCDMNESSNSLIPTSNLVNHGAKKYNSRQLAAIRHGDCAFGKISKEYKAWAQMLYRCETPSCRFYAHYGGRGIKVCLEWHQFSLFLRDMGRAPAGTSIDRINNNGDYCPKNCRWATRSQQQLNRRVNHFLVVNGTSKTIHQWQREMGFGRMTILNRLNRGWKTEDAVLTPLYGKSH